MQGKSGPAVRLKTGAFVRIRATGDRHIDETAV